MRYDSQLKTQLFKILFFMKTIHYTLIITALMMLFHVQLKAQDVMELSLEQSIQYAIENNIAIRNAAVSQAESQMMLRETIANGLPQVSAKVDYQNFFDATASIGPMQFTFNPTSNLNFTVGQLIFSGNYIVGIQMAMLYRDISEASQEKTTVEIRAQVMNAYFLILVAERSREILLQNSTNMEKLLVQMEAMLQAEMVNETDRDQIQIQLTNIQTGLNTAQRQIEMAYNMLRLLLGLNPDQSIKLTDTMVQIIDRMDFKNGLNRQFNISNNTDYKLMQLQTEISEKNMWMEKMSFLPSMSAFYSYTEKIKKPEFDMSPKQIIGFNISIPLFSSGSRYYSHQQSKLKLQIAQNQMMFISDQLLIQEKQLKYNLKTSMEQYDIQRQNIELARRVYENIYNRYQQGTVSSIELINASNSLLMAENNYVSALMQMFEAKTAIDKLYNEFTF
jgi:outer membrane protein